MHPLLRCRHCKAGEQCLLSYGPLPNLKLLLFYGFTLPSNPSDTVLLSFQVTPKTSVDKCFILKVTEGVYGLYWNSISPHT